MQDEAMCNLFDREHFQSPFKKKLCLEKVLLEQASQYTDPTTVMLLAFDRNLASVPLNISSNSSATDTATRAAKLLAIGGQRARKEGGVTAMEIRLEADGEGRTSIDELMRRKPEANNRM